jgi:hypothetical protein
MSDSNNYGNCYIGSYTDRDSKRLAHPERPCDEVPKSYVSGEAYER